MGWGDDSPLSSFAPAQPSSTATTGSSRDALLQSLLNAPSPNVTGVPVRKDWRGTEDVMNRIGIPSNPAASDAVQDITLDQMLMGQPIAKGLGAALSASRSLISGIIERQAATKLGMQADPYMLPTKSLDPAQIKMEFGGSAPKAADVMPAPSTQEPAQVIARPMRFSTSIPLSGEQKAIIEEGVSRGRDWTTSHFARPDVQDQLVKNLTGYPARNATRFGYGAPSEAGLVQGIQGAPQAAMDAISDTHILPMPKGNMGYDWANNQFKINSQFLRSVFSPGVSPDRAMQLIEQGTLHEGTHAADAAIMRGGLGLDINPAYGESPSLRLQAWQSMSGIDPSASHIMSPELQAAFEAGNPTGRGLADELGLQLKGGKSLKGFTDYVQSPPEVYAHLNEIRNRLGNEFGFDINRLDVSQLKDVLAYIKADPSFGGNLRLFGGMMKSPEVMKRIMQLLPVAAGATAVEQHYDGTPVQ